MAESKFFLAVHPLAKQEVLNIRANRPDLFSALIDNMKLLAALSDPRRHHDVKSLDDDLQGWYRLVLYDHNFRILFRILWAAELGDTPVEIWPGTSMPTMGQFTIEITRAAPRRYAYDDTTQRRYSRR